MKHTAIYVRVSSDKQSTASQTPELRAAEQRYLASGESVVWYEDTFTGKTMNRPEWNRLDAELKAGNVSRVVVWRLDRLGRTSSGLTALFDRFVTDGIEFVSLRDGIDLLTPAGRMLAGILANVAQFETECRLERVKAGIAAAKAKGKKWGGSKKGRRLKLSAVKERRARELIAAGEYSTREVARLVNIGKTTIVELRKRMRGEGVLLTA